MWRIKTFLTQQLMNEWIKENEHKYSIDIIFINDGYGVEYKDWKYFF